MACLLASHDNARFLQNIVRWLLDDGDPALNLNSPPHHSLGTYFFNNRLEIEHGIEAHKDQQFARARLISEACPHLHHSRLIHDPTQVSVLSDLGTSDVSSTQRRNSDTCR